MIEKEKENKNDTEGILDILSIIKNDLLIANDLDNEKFELFITKAELMLSFLQKQFNLENKSFDDTDSGVEESDDSDAESNESEIKESEDNAEDENVVKMSPNISLTQREYDIIKKYPARQMTLPLFRDVFGNDLKSYTLTGRSRAGLGNRLDDTLIDEIVKYVSKVKRHPVTDLRNAIQNRIRYLRYRT